MAKLHVRHMVGGHSPAVRNELIYRFEFPEQPGELMEFLEKLEVSSSTLSRVLNGFSRVTPEMPPRLAKALGRSPESWLAMQDAHDLWMARQRVNLN
ncbi:HigA family addiction module antitoxin [Thermithiobacillus plumbiphilus]|uniref:HigA family addiction module antitoxin n=1 Tax=Thermithiobacillus plumbiphilus TaxID=1729899 RepID=A0ABU9DBM5_9PROT